MIPELSPSPRILLPVNYLPRGAGRWKGVLINDPCVVAAVISVVKPDFEEQYGKYMKKVKKVNFLINSGLLVTKYPKDNALSDRALINGGLVETSRDEWQCETHDFFSYQYWSIVPLCFELQYDYLFTDSRTQNVLLFPFISILFIKLFSCV